MQVSNICEEVYPTEYAYLSDTINVYERSSANCRMYPAGYGKFSENYTHCGGTHLRLTDSDFGSEQYSSYDYYVWNAQNAGSSSQLLFIFPTRVNLTSITLHYYSDNIRGLPRLRFYAVPDDFDVWDGPAGSYSRVDIAAVSSGGEPAGRRNVSVNVNFNTNKILMYKYGSVNVFAMSEVQFISFYYIKLYS